MIRFKFSWNIWVKIPGSSRVECVLFSIPWARSGSFHKNNKEKNIPYKQVVIFPCKSTSICGQDREEKLSRVTFKCTTSTTDSRRICETLQFDTFLQGYLYDKWSVVGIPWQRLDGTPKWWTDSVQDGNKKQQIDCIPFGFGWIVLVYYANQVQTTRRRPVFSLFFGIKFDRRSR